MKTSRVPSLVGFGVALLLVLLIGNQVVTEEILDRLDDNPWMRSLLGGQWRLTADGRPFDFYVIGNSFVVVYLGSLFVLLWVLLANVRRPAVAAATAWGATAAAGLCGAMARGVLAVITDNPVFSVRFEPSLLDNVVGSVDQASSYVLWSGMLVALGVAVATVVTGDSSPAPAPYPTPPAPPMTAPPPAPSPAPVPQPPPPAAGPPPDSF